MIVGYIRNTYYFGVFFVLIAQVDAESLVPGSSRSLYPSYRLDDGAWRG